MSNYQISIQGVGDLAAARKAAQAAVKSLKGHTIESAAFVTNDGREEITAAAPAAKKKARG